MRRRSFLSLGIASACDALLIASVSHDSRAFAAEGLKGGGAGDLPSLPGDGEIKAISHNAGMHPLGAGATLAEINPSLQPWNPEFPQPGPYRGADSNGYGWGSINGYSGICWNTDTRQLVNYGAGHASINVCAPFCFDLNDLRWKWLDTPLPFDGYGRVLVGRHSVPPSQAVIDSLYPNGEIDYPWGELNGDSPGWEKAYGSGPWLRPGRIQPIPGHTRNVLAHIPAVILGNRKGGLFKFGSAGGILSGARSSCSHIFDYDTKTWKRTTNQAPHFGNGVSSTAQSTVIDTETRTAIHYGGGNQFKVFDFSTDSWRPLRISSNSYPGSVDAGNVLAFRPARLLICAFARDVVGERAYYNGQTFAFFAVPIDAIVGKDAFSVTPLNVSVASWPLNEAGNNTGIGFGYCPDDRCFYCINGDTNSNRYWKLQPPVAMTQSGYLSGTWTLTEHVFSSGVLSSPGKRSWVFNRLSWDEKWRAFLWFPDAISGPVQAFRPRGV